MKNYFGYNLKFLRKSFNLSQQQLAEIVGKTFTAVSRWEAGLREPSDKIVQKYREHFGVSPAELMYRPLPNTTLQKKKHDYWVKASEQFPELPEIRVHSFRHSCASLLINSGATIIYISKYLGHSSTKETLDTYAHFFPNESDRMAEVINPKI